MELSEAKKIVEEMNNSLIETINKFSIEDYNEAIRLIAISMINNDNESIELSKNIPAELQFIGLYPHRIKNF